MNTYIITYFVYHNCIDRIMTLSKTLFADSFSDAIDKFKSLDFEGLKVVISSIQYIGFVAIESQPVNIHCDI